MVSLTIRKILANVSWLAVDKILRMVVGFFVYTWVAKYLGAEQFGLWNYCIAFAGLFVVLSNLGLDDVVVRELVRGRGSRDNILGTAFVLKIFAGLITCIVTLVAIFLVRTGEELTMTLVGLYSAGYILQSMNVIDFYFKSKLNAKYSVYAADGGFIISTSLKVMLLLFEAPLIAFAIVGLFEVGLVSLFLVMVYRAKKLSIFDWEYHKNVALELLIAGFPLILFGISIMLLMRVDQVMIGQILGNREVGLYSASVRVSEVIMALPGILIVSLFPAIITSRAKSQLFYEKRVQEFFSLMVLISLGLSVPVWIFSDQIIDLLFGKEFAKSGNILAILICSSVFASLGLASKNVLMAEDLQRYIFYRTIFALLINIVLNFWLIPIYGIEGAAFATVISQFFLAYLSDAIFQKTRKLFLLKTKAFYLSGLYSSIQGLKR
jgi:O-antigen/teichoic acid export membrane protein